MHREVVDHEVWSEENKGNFGLSIIARLRGPSVTNVQYMIRLRSPEYETIDYMTTLEGFKELGELLLALHDFSKLPLYANEKHVDKLKELLTADNIKKLSEIIKTSRLGK